MTEPLTEQDIKRFRIGDILFSDEQAKMFCDLALKGLRAEAGPSAGTVHSMTGVCPTCGSDANEALSPSATTSKPHWHNTMERVPEEASIVLGLWYGTDGRPQQQVVVYARPEYWHNEDDDEDDYRPPDYWRELPETPR